MLNKEMSAGTNAEQSKKDETRLPSSPTSGNTNVVRSWLLSYRRKAAKEKGRTATCNKFLSLHNFLSSQNKEQMFVVRWLAVAQ